MSSARRHSIWAMGRRDDVTITITGVGWKGYDAGASVNSNLARIAPDADIIMAYKPDGHQRERTPAVIGLREVKQPVVLRFNEAWWADGQAAKEVKSAGASLVICHHPGDVGQFKACDDTVRIEVIPHCAEKTVYGAHRLSTSQRKTEVLFVGVQAKGTYPLRHKLWKMMRNGLPGIKSYIHPHPGYWMNSLEHCERMVKEYASNLGRAKIVVACTSCYKYPLAKYVEASMAGAVVVGDAPRLHDSDRFPDYDKLFYEVDAGAPEAELRATLRKLLDDPEALQARAALAQQTAMELYSQEVYATRFVSIVRDMIGS